MQLLWRQAYKNWFLSGNEPGGLRQYRIGTRFVASLSGGTAAPYSGCNFCSTSLK